MDSDIGGEEMGTDEEQNTGKRGTVKICADQKEERDRNVVGTSYLPVE